MKNLIDLSKQQDSANYKKIFEIIGSKQTARHFHEGVADSLTDSPEQISHSVKEVEDIKSALWQEVIGGMAIDGQSQTMEEVGKGLIVNMENIVKKAKSGGEGMSADAFFNEFTGIGTGLDPGAYNNASIPVVISPQEATSYYSNGGIAGTVIDKKSRGIFTNGYQFVGGLEEDELKELKDYADKLNFVESVVEWWRDGWIYGGSCLLPWLRGDNVLTHEMSIEELGRAGMLRKDCLQYFWTADRWNSVLIPNYNISARDYLTPETFYIPLAGLTVKTERMAIARPKKLPYWGTIRQMGWGISDFPSFMPSLLAYEIMIRTIPIISQQLSLVYLHAPLDSILAQTGVNQVRKVMEANQEALSQWNSLKTQILNMAGELKSIERHWTDFDKLVLLGQKDVGAKAGISHTVLWNEQQGGMNEKNYDITLNQAETVKLSGNQCTIQVQNIIQFLVYSKWGWGSPQAQKAKEVRLSLEAPTVLTNQENIDSLAAVGNALTQFTTAGFQLGDAVEMVRKFVPKFEPDEQMAARIEAFDDAEQEFEEETREQTLELGKQKTDSTEADDKGTGNPPVPAAATVGDSRPKSWIDTILRRKRV